MVDTSIDRDLSRGRLAALQHQLPVCTANQYWYFQRFDSVSSLRASRRTVADPCMSLLRLPSSEIRMNDRTRYKFSPKTSYRPPFDVVERTPPLSLECRLTRPADIPANVVNRPQKTSMTRTNSWVVRCIQVHQAERGSFEPIGCGVSRLHRG